MPRIFYKYRGINENTDSLLKNQELHFSFGYEYNDPFDSKVRIESVGSNEDILMALETTQIDNGQKEFIKNSIIQGIFDHREMVEMAYETAKKTIISSCFCEGYDDVLMWTHYADSHKGICLGFSNVSTENTPALKFDCGNIPGDPATLENGVFPLTKVKYDINEIVTWVPFQDDIGTFIDAHQRKAKWWEYEKEYRIIIPYKEFGTQILRFDKRYLREVYFGARISEENFSKYKTIINEEYLNNGFDTAMSG
ncbi:MAG: DUF2971 domain-containing protein [Smithella sp.]